MYKRAKIICSYFKMNNKDDKFKISKTARGFSITKNNEKCFDYGCNDLYTDMIYYINNLLIKRKQIYKIYRIINIETSKIKRNYECTLKEIYYNNMSGFIQYTFKKNTIVFLSYTNYIQYRIDIEYSNKFIYKFHGIDKWGLNRSKYTNYKILIPNKYELLYYSNYFLVFL